MTSEEKATEISYEVRVKPGRSGTDPNAPDWEVLELEDGEIKTSRISTTTSRWLKLTRSPECGAEKKRRLGLIVSQFENRRM